MRILTAVVFSLMIGLAWEVQAQDASNFSQFFLNPYTMNPSYAGIEGKKAIFLAYRKQWSGIDASPTVMNFSFHAPSAGGLNYGINITNDTRGLVSNTGVQLSLAYALVIDRHKFIRFGASAGMASNVIDFADLSPELLADPVFADALEKNLSLIGNAGISFHINGLHFGVAMPNLFTPAYVSQDAFTISEVKPFQSLIPHLSYRYYFGNDKHVFEPYLVYRINQGLPSQLEAAGILHLNHKVWIGGTFKQDFGITALGGLKLSELLAIGGSYSLKNSGRNELNSPTYEIQLSYLAGNKKKNAEIYSFVSTVKEKERRLQRKSASEQIAERRRQEELARRKQQAERAKQKEQEDLAAKKQDEQKKAAEEQARKQEEERKRAAESLVLQQKQHQQQQKATQEQVTPTTTPAVVQPPVKRHDGGPRLKSEVLSMGFPVYDTAHHQEQERLGKLSEHASAPDEVHGLDPTSHPNAERHEFVKRGVHPDELPVGDYVISGVFKSDANARHFAEGLKKMGFSADYGHLTERNLWYVYIAQTSDINEARMERDKYRQMKIFKDAWLLTVHH